MCETRRDMRISRAEYRTPAVSDSVPVPAPQVAPTSSKTTAPKNNAPRKSRKPASEEEGGWTYAGKKSKASPASVPAPTTVPKPRSRGPPKKST
jgi:hypothetical protein